MSVCVCERDWGGGGGRGVLMCQCVCVCVCVCVCARVRLCVYACGYNVKPFYFLPDIDLSSTNSFDGYCLFFPFGGRVDRAD